MATHSTDDEGLELFREAVTDVRPLQHDKVEHTWRVPQSRQRKGVEQPVNGPELSHTGTATELQAGDVVSFARPGVQHKQLRKLRRGQIESQDSLDLHGLTSLEAHRTLSAFITASAASNLHCVTVIHGKGKNAPGTTPVLKNEAIKWLREQPQVLAFCTARPEHGGSGALYVLLKSLG